MFSTLKKSLCRKLDESHPRGRGRRKEVLRRGKKKPAFLEKSKPPALGGPGEREREGFIRRLHLKLRRGVDLKGFLQMQVTTNRRGRKECVGGGKKEGGTEKGQIRLLGNGTAEKKSKRATERVKHLHGGSGVNTGNR